MQKLTFYAMMHPEKLDKIGEYVAERLARDIYRGRQQLIVVSVEAMDQLLAACHGSNGLNMFVESFLLVVQYLLDTADPSMEVMATKSFVNFCNIEEDTPGYHRQYDYFISKFSSMCHNNQSNLTVRDKLRVSGLKGLRGVVRKTVADDLQANIWDRQHMEKIVPSILFNMHDKGLEQGSTLSTSGVSDVGDSTATGGAAESPRATADSCLRELMGKASFGSMKSVLTPLLRHCDNHNLWMPPPDYPITFFRAVMYSVQNQYLYVVIQALIGHLDQHGGSKADMRIGMATVLADIVPIAATSIGPGLLEIFNSLLRHLRASVELQLSDACPSIENEKRYQETLINAMGDFANSLPDYQKVEVMMFTIGKVPMGERMQRSDTFLQHVLLKTLLKVATKYRTSYLGTALSGTFLEPLLRLALVPDSRVRLLTQQILHTLVDRHQNLSSVQHLNFVPHVQELRLSVEKCSRADQVFMRKHGGKLLSTLYRCMVHMDPSQTHTNTADNYDAILCTMTLLCLEVGCDEVLVELFRLALGLQTAANDMHSALSYSERAANHQLVARFMNLASQLTAIPALCQHVQHIGKLRAQRGPASIDPYMEGPILPAAPYRTGTINGIKAAAGGKSHPPKLAVVRSGSDTSGASMSLVDEDDCDVLVLDDELLFSATVIQEALMVGGGALGATPHRTSGKEAARISVAFSARDAPLMGTTGGAAHARSHASFRAGSPVTEATSMDHSIASGETLTDPRRVIPSAPGAMAAADLPDTGLVTTGGADGTRGAIGATTTARRMGPAGVDGLRDALLNTTADSVAKSEQQHTESVLKLFRDRPFEEIVAMNAERQRDTYSTVCRILKRVDERNALVRMQQEDERSGEHGDVGTSIFDIELPDLVVY